MIPSNRKPPWPFELPAPMPVMQISLLTPACRIAETKARDAFDSSVTSWKGLAGVPRDYSVCPGQSPLQHSDIASIAFNQGCL